MATRDSIRKRLADIADSDLVYEFRRSRLVMLAASRQQKVPLDRISFIDALRWLRDAESDTLLTGLVVNPARPNRVEPRVIKRRMKKYTLMKKPRRDLRKALERQKDAA